MAEGRQDGKGSTSSGWAKILGNVMNFNKKWNS